MCYTEVHLKADKDVGFYTGLYAWCYYGFVSSAVVRATCEGLAGGWCIGSVRWRKVIRLFSLGLGMSQCIVSVAGIVMDGKAHRLAENLDRRCQSAFPPSHSSPSTVP